MVAVINISVSSIVTWWIYNLFWRNFTEAAHTKCIVKYDKTAPPIIIYN